MCVEPEPEPEPEPDASLLPSPLGSCQVPQLDHAAGLLHDPHPCLDDLTTHAIAPLPQCTTPLGGPPTSRLLEHTRRGRQPTVQSAAPRLDLHPIPAPAALHHITSVSTPLTCWPVARSTSSSVATSHTPPTCAAALSTSSSRCAGSSSRA